MSFFSKNKFNKINKETTKLALRKAELQKIEVEVVG